MADDDLHQSPDKPPSRLSLEWDFENLARAVRVQWGGNRFNFVDVPDPGGIHEDNHWDGHTDSHLDSNGDSHGDFHFDDHTDDHFDHEFVGTGEEIVEFRRLIVIVRGLEQRIAELERAMARLSAPGGQR